MKYYQEQKEEMKIQNKIQSENIISYRNFYLVVVGQIISILGSYQYFTLFLLSALPIAMIMTIISIFVVTKVQKETPNNFLGKVMATITDVSQCAVPAGRFVYGIIFKNFKQFFIFQYLLLVLLCLFFHL